MCGPLTSKRTYARMAELADAYDLGSYVNSCGFKSHFGHHYTRNKKVVLGGRSEDAHPVDDVKPCGPFWVEVLYTDLLFQLPLAWLYNC